MKYSFVFALALSAALAACGGGGGSSAGAPPPPPPAGTSAPALDAPPTGTLPPSDANARSLATEISSGAREVWMASTRPTNLPGGIDLTLAVGATVDCSTYFPGGTGSITVDTNATGLPTTGTVTTITYNNCGGTISGQTISYNGSVKVEYTRYTSASDFAITVSATNLTYRLSGTTYGPDSFTYSYDYKSGSYSFTYRASNGGAIGLTGTVSVSGSQATISSATYVFQSTPGSGIVKVEYTNWKFDTTTGRPISGSAKITGSGGASVTITVTSTGYTIDYVDASGTKVTYNVPFGG
jgi:hypothetical protein